MLALAVAVLTAGCGGGGGSTADGDTVAATANTAETPAVDTGGQQQATPGPGGRHTYLAEDERYRIDVTLTELVDPAKRRLDVGTGVATPKRTQRFVTVHIRLRNTGRAFPSTVSAQPHLERTVLIDAEGRSYSSFFAVATSLGDFSKPGSGSAYALWFVLSKKAKLRAFQLAIASGVEGLGRETLEWDL